MSFQALSFLALIGTALAVDLGSFSNPSSQSRARFRYWIPDASVDLDAVAADIKSAGAVGAGGVELLGYYWYGDQDGETVSTDWTKYTWGTTAWSTFFTVRSTNWRWLKVDGQHQMFLVYFNQIGNPCED
jgi:hypothetical protein